jgi:hypothetical protein
MRIGIPPARGARKASCIQRALEEAMDKRINEERSSHTEEDPNCGEVNVGEAEEAQSNSGRRPQFRIV